MTTLLWVMLGGAMGSASRYGIGLLFKERSAEFPLATLTVNLVGCFLIGFLATWLASVDLRPVIRIGLLVGVLGGFTTFSSFGLETLALIQEGRWSVAAVYVASSNVGGLLLAWLGYGLAQSFVATPPTG